MNQYNDRLKRVIAALQETAEKLGIHPAEVTKAQILKCCDGVSSWDIREVGGLGTLRSAHFPVVSKDLLTIREQKNTTKYISELEKRIGDKELFENELCMKMEKLIVPVVPRQAAPIIKNDKTTREVVAMLNDVHYGLIVRPEEVGGTNKYDWLEACRRTAMMAEQIVNYKIEKRDQVKRLHLVLAGDMLQGVIHDLTARTAELMVHQMGGALHILTHFLAYVAEYYPEVVVHGIAGNHDDQLHRREGGRVISHKYDSFANMVYFGLSAAFRNHKNIKFNFPKSLMANVDLLGGRLLITHGDTLFSTALGNPSNTLNIRSLSDVINRFNSGEMAKGEKRIDAVLMGHVHSYTNFITFDGVKVVIAPSLSGLDSFAASLSINFNQVGQIIFESTKKYVMSDLRLVELVEADKQEKYDKIIPVFKNTLQFAA